MTRAVLALALLLPAAAHAQPADEPSDPPRGTYTGSMMLADGLSIASFATGFVIARTYECDCEEMGSGYLMLFGLGGYVMGGPALHAIHDRHGRAWASGLLRVGLPVIGGSIAYGATRSAGQTAASAPACSAR